MTIQYAIYYICGAFVLGLSIGATLFIYTLSKNKKLSNFIDIFKKAQDYIEEIESSYAPINKFVGNNMEVKSAINDNKLTDVYALLVEYANANGKKLGNEIDTKNMIIDQVAFSKMQQKYK